MTTHFHQPTQPISIFLENPSVDHDHFVSEVYDLKVTLEESTSCLAFEPFISIVQFALNNCSEPQKAEILALPKTFTVLRPILRRYFLGEKPGSREPLNTDELGYEQIEIYRGLADIIQTCFREQKMKVAITSAQNISPSAFEFLQQEDYRMPSRLQLDFFLSTEAFSNLKISQGFSTQIKRRHLSAPRLAGERSEHLHSLTISADASKHWSYLRNAISLYTSGEMLVLADLLESEPNLNDDQYAELNLARMYAWVLKKDSERCHIYMQELQHINLDNLPEAAVSRTLKAICVGYLCLSEYSAAEKALSRYHEYSQNKGRDKDLLLADFYLFLAQCFSGKLNANTQDLDRLTNRLEQQRWKNLAAFVKCSHWFNEQLIDDESEDVIENCIASIYEYESLKNVIGQSTAHHHISIVLGTVGQPKEAIAHINRALAQTQQCGLSVRIHNTLNGLAFLLNGLGQSDAAQEALEAAYPLVLADGNFDQICTTLYNLALVSFYADHVQSTISLLDDVFSIMEFRNMTSTRFRTKAEMLALQAIAAYLDGDRRLPFAIKPQLENEQPRSHEGEAFIRCIGLITQPFSADEAEHFFIEISEQFSKLRQNMHLDLLALRLLITYLKDIGESERANTWIQQGLRQCKQYNLEQRIRWFRNEDISPILSTSVEPKQAILLAHRQMGVDALKLENGLLNTLAAFNETALRSSNIDELIATFLTNMQRLVNVGKADIELNFLKSESIRRVVENDHTYHESMTYKTMTFEFKFIGGEGSLNVTFLGDLINRSSEAKNIVLKICQQLSRATEFILDREDSHRLAYHDPLTQVYNRVAFEEDVERIIKQNTAHRMCLAFIDLDKFKAVNDTLGHLAGDQFLRTFVDVLATRVRADDRIYRIGGDEFLVNFIDIPIKKAEQALSRFSAQFFHVESLKAIGISEDMKLGCSIGLIECQLGNSAVIDVDLLISEADQLMYEAKRSDGDRIFSKVLNNAC